MSELVERLASLRGVAAIALGGSYARGAPRPDSDVDLGLYYREREPFAIDEIRAVAECFQLGAAPVVTDFYEWGPWANGGAWLATRVGRVDLIYRSLEHVDRVVSDARAGRAEWHYAQTPTHGFHAVTYLAELADAIPLCDPHGLLEARKRDVAVYPAPLRAAIVQNQLWGAEFTLEFARAFAQRADVYNTVGCLTRTLAHLTQVLYALNERYFMNDKRALAEIEAFPRRPDDYAARVARILSRPGDGAAELSATAECLAALTRTTAELAGALYRPAYPLAGVLRDPRHGPPRLSEILPT